MAATIQQLPRRRVGAKTDPPVRPDRAGKRVIAGHFDADTYFAFHQLRAEISRRAGDDFTVQQAVVVAMRLLFDKYGFELPDELKNVKRPACRPRAKSTDTKSRHP